ncbi:hypothetical protein L1987_54872 [Smallanthus sonchifolius]|uniref:Uncharacterized protein n=1 Tax=Smallanthus sonchifolius TaxID=185202 RepID=A0ACB9E7Z5_9ASTR|nr:hypothetical protein L1987_54872 [Smallanthus sonchifolius]
MGPFKKKNPDGIYKFQTADLYPTVVLIVIGLAVRSTPSHTVVLVCNPWRYGIQPSREAMTAAEVGDPARRCNLWDFISSRVHRKLLMHSGCPAQIWSMRSSNGSISLEKVSFWLRYREDAFQILPRYHFVLSWHFYFLISHSLRSSNMVDEDIQIEMKDEGADVSISCIFTVS